MLTDKIADELNIQINEELKAAYFYLSLAAFFDVQSLDGFSHWMKTQSQEEVAHAMKVYNYLVDCGKSPTMLALPQPQTSFDSTLHAFEVALEHEEKLARRLDQLSQHALEAKDNTTYSFLKWFLEEQVEEVALVGGVVDKLRLIGDNGFGILMLNNELGERKGDPAESA